MTGCVVHDDVGVSFMMTWVCRSGWRGCVVQDDGGGRSGWRGTVRAS